MRILIVEDEPPIADYIEECSMTEYGSMLNPEFIMAFSDILKYQN